MIKVFQWSWVILRGSITVFVSKMCPGQPSTYLVHYRHLTASDLLPLHSFFSCIDSTFFTSSSDIVVSQQAGDQGEVEKDDETEDQVVVMVAAT
jgi:hypothetical protein